MKLDTTNSLPFQERPINRKLSSTNFRKDMKTICEQINGRSIPETGHGDYQHDK